MSLWIYFKTWGLQTLTGHKGIKYFRLTFLFLGIAYATRLLLRLLIITSGWRGAVTMALVGYFSTMAFFYMLYSTLWKRTSSKLIMHFANLFAIGLAIGAAILRSPSLLSVIQLALILSALVIGGYKKKFSKIRVIYLLLLVLWALNLSQIGYKRFLPVQINIAFHAMSVVVLFFVYYRVSKWTK